MEENARRGHYGFDSCGALDLSSGSSAGTNSTKVSADFSKYNGGHNCWSLGYQCFPCRLTPTSTMYNVSQKSSLGRRVYDKLIFGPPCIICSILKVSDAEESDYGGNDIIINGKRSSDHLDLETDLRKRFKNELDQAEHSQPKVINKRKNIRQVFENDKLTDTTKEAKVLEEERLQRFCCLS